ncbi:MAG: FKBP-type peptidyl-prolyl cis-trans isomerase [Paludibacteraceae bacterium]|nr:FKBP-type peptidyl-prolyl cis-trans isomerase [Paludibacteraceae bacterium]MBR4839591.1 FKBP-type peptidyl-prolyl cis-trans isomerase [Paludibacteraceae bacterium]
MNILKFKHLIFAFGSLVALTFASCDKDSDSSEDIIAKNKATKEEGETFLLENRSAEGVVETYSGLQYKVDTVGKGEKPILSDSVTMKYVAKLSDGTIFAKSDKETLLLSSQIAGLRQGLRYMREGSKFTLYIPYYLAYDVNGRSFRYNGSVVTVNSYSLVIFECNLLSIKHN